MSRAWVSFRRIGRVAVVIAALVSIAAPVGRTSAQEREYRLGSQDEVVVTVFGQEDLSGEFRVDGEGRLSLPLIGDVHVGGLSINGAEAAVADKLYPDYLKNPRVSIQVTNYRPFYILGEVEEPGSYPYVNGMTVVQAVALAGGFTYRASQDEIVIVRGSAGGRGNSYAGQRTAVLPGDIIKVPERFF